MHPKHLDSSILFIIIGCLLLAAILIFTSTKPTPRRFTPINPATPTTVITEDDPRWDCHTMGNRVCGQP